MVSQQLAKKYYIQGTQEEDIVQEAYILGMGILEKFDNKKGKLENFLRIALNNALQNFVKARSINTKSCGCLPDQYCSKCRYLQSKANVILTRQYPENIEFEEKTNIKDSWVELLPLIDRKLPSSMRQDWRRILDNSPVVKSRKAEIFEEIREIVKEFEEHGEEDSGSYEFGWENGYFYVENEQHLAKLYMDEEAANIWLHTLCYEARQTYIKLRECGTVSYEEIVVLADSIDKNEMWDV